MTMPVDLVVLVDNNFIFSILSILIRISIVSSASMHY